MAGVGNMQRIWQDAFRMAGAVQETCSSELFGGPGVDFLRGIFSFGKMILRDRCSTSYDLASLFPWQARYFRQVGGVEKFKTNWHEAVSSALNFPFLKEVLQNCVVFDVVNLEN